MSGVEASMPKAPLTRQRFHVEPYQNRIDRPRVYTGTDETFHTELLAVPELVHLESRSRTEPNQKVLIFFFI